MAHCRIPLRDLQMWESFRGLHWDLRDGAVGAAWVVGSEVAKLHELATNFIYHPDFQGAYLQLIWGVNGPETVLATLKAFLPEGRAPMPAMASDLVRRQPVGPGGREALRAEGEAAFARQAEAFEEVASLASLRPRKVTDTDPFERAYRRAVGELVHTQAIRVTPRGLLSDAATAAPLPVLVASLRRYPTLALEELPPLLEGRRVSDGLYTITLVQDGVRTDDYLEAWLYPFVIAPTALFRDLEREWAPHGYQVSPERELAFPILSFLLPCGAVPAFETSLEPRAICVQMGLELTVDAARGEV